MDQVIGTLEPKDYWEWRTTVVEMQLEQSLHELQIHKLALMEKDLEIGRLRIGIYKQTLEVSKAKADSARKEYDRFKKLLEEKLGSSLNDCVIDDISYEVKKLSKE